LDILKKVGKSRANPIPRSHLAGHVALSFKQRKWKLELLQSSRCICIIVWSRSWLVVLLRELSRTPRPTPLPTMIHIPEVLKQDCYKLEKIW